MASATETTAFELDPTYYSFDSTVDCDPEATNADVQVVQAFFTAYNERNLTRLTELIDTNEIWDPSGAAHTGQVRLTDVVAWAESGWEVDDRFQMERMVGYGPSAGSDVILTRQNEVLESIGIDGLVVGFKIPSAGCTIGRLVGHLAATVPANCGFYDVFLEVLQEELAQDWTVPAICTVTTPRSINGPGQPAFEHMLGTADRTCVDVDVIVATEEPRMVGPDDDPQPVFDVRSGEILAGNFASVVNQWSTDWPDGQAKIYWIPFDAGAPDAGSLEVVVESFDGEHPTTLQTFDTAAFNSAGTFWPSGTKFPGPGRYRLIARAAGHWACFELTV